jgi:two-component system phosphate regulon sensor histidine kinase PhoR
MEQARILIVEDESIVALDLQTSLGGLGYDVLLSVSSGEEAIASAERTHPDLILMDIMLDGEMDGIEAAGQIRKQFGIPVVFLTAYADEDTLRRAKITEPFGYLLKPFEERELHTTIEMALYKHRAEEALRRRDAILAAVSFAAQQFLQAVTWQEPIQSVLQRLGRAANVSRVYLLRNSPARHDPSVDRDCRQWLASPTEEIETRTLQDHFRPGGELERWAGTLRRNQPIHGHIHQFPERERQILADRGIQSAAAVPIFVERSWWGLIGFDECLRKREWSPAEIDALKAAASILGAAIQRTRLHQQIEQRAREMSTLYDVSTAGIRSIRLDEMLCQTVSALERAHPADSIAVLLLSPESDELVLGASYGLPAPQQKGTQTIGAGIPCWVVQTGQPALVPDVGGDERYHFSDPDTRSVICAPLQTGQRTVGAIHLESHQRAAFSQEDLRLLSMVAGHLAALIENAWLVEGLEETVAARTAEIVAEKEKSETILQNVGDAIAMIDRESRIRYINPAFTLLTGYAEDQIVGRPFVRVLSKDPPDKDRVSLLRALVGGDPWQGDVVVQRRDGRIYEASLTLAPIRDAQGEVAGSVSSHQDISQRKRLERARSQFISSVSHELRTPASQMKLCAQILQRGLRPDDRQRHLQVIGDQVDRLLELIEDVLLMAELDSGEVIATWAPISVSRLIRDTVARYRAQAGEALLSLRAEPVELDLPVVFGDRARLQQALGELVENAIVFTPADGLVTVKAGTVDEAGQVWLTVAVSDTGPGIPPEEQEHVFDRLFRGSLAESGHLPGTGLGLSMAQAILHAHGGRLTVESKPGVGSLFSLWLPVIPDSQEKPGFLGL